MKKVKLALIATAAIFCYSCGGKTEADFSIVPIQGSNKEFQYIDIPQNGKIVINPQFERAHIFRDGLALVKTTGKDGKWGYIDKKGKFAIAPVYNKAQDFSEDVAWVQLEDQPPMLIDKKGKTVLQIDSAIAAYPFSNGTAGITVYSQGEWMTMFIDKKGNSVAATIPGEGIVPLMSEGLYAFQDKTTEKWGAKNKNGEIVVNAQFDYLFPFLDGISVVRSGDKWGAIDKKGSFVINPQYDSLGYDSDGLFVAKVGKKWGWVNKKNEIVINPQFDAIAGFNKTKLSSVQMGDKWAYIDKKGQIVINPQFIFAFPFDGKYAMVISSELKVGFIDMEGKFAVPALYGITENCMYEYVLAIMQNVWNVPVQYFMKYLDPRSKSSVYQTGDFDNYSRLKEKKEEHRKRAVAAAAGTVTDSRDNKTYKTIKIGTQTWMAQNLNYVGDGYLGLCYGAKPREQIFNPENCEKFGRLYDWSEAMGLDREFNGKRFGNDDKVQGVCPPGWHLPSDAEWTTLTNFVGGAYAAGTKLKATSGWAKNGEGTDEYGFSLLPDGDGEYSRMWTATEYSTGLAWRRRIDFNSSYVNGDYPNKSNPYSVRCVKD